MYCNCVFIWIYQGRECVFVSLGSNKEDKYVYSRVLGQIENKTKYEGLEVEIKEGFW